MRRMPVQPLQGNMNGVYLGNLIRASRGMQPLADGVGGPLWESWERGYGGLERDKVRARGCIQGGPREGRGKGVKSVVIKSDWRFGNGN
jgi:hypothetical protein